MGRKWSLPREGLYIDPISVWARMTILNPWIMTGIFALLRWKRVEGTLAMIGFKHNSSQVARWIAGLGIFGLLLNMNDYLTDGFHNNWTADDSWNWDEEIVLITGGSSGIGAGVARQLLERNKNTKVIIIDYAPLSFKVPEKSKLYYYQCDLSKSDEIRRTCAAIRKEVGSPTVVFNNAGLTRGATVMGGSYGDVEVTFKTNVIAAFLILKEFLPAMVKKNHGHVIATSSMSSIITPAGLADYGATKAGLNALHEALSLELKHKHEAPRVRLSLVTLGFVATPMFKGETNESDFLTPLLHTDTVVDRIVDTLLSGRGKNIYLPGLMRYMSCIRGCPSWMMKIVANGTNELKVDFVGRQRIDAKTGNLR